jgi:hypothetical protein
MATRVLDADGEVAAALSVVVAAGSVDVRAIRPAISRRLGWHPSAGGP